MIHKTAIVHDQAIVPETCSVGPYSVIYNHVNLGHHVTIGSYCEIGVPHNRNAMKHVHIGPNSTIRSHTCIYQGSSIGENLHTGHYAMIRELSSIGRDVQIGNRSDVQGDCTIGDFTKIHGDVHIGKFTSIGKFCWLFPGVLVTNDPCPPSTELIGAEIGDYVVIASKSLIMPGVSIGEHAVVAAMSQVNIDIPAKKLASGSPAKILCNTSLLRYKGKMNKSAYPWTKRFYRGYPKEITDQW